jgi:hypothetical protein
VAESVESPIGPNVPGRLNGNPRADVAFAADDDIQF